MPSLPSSVRAGTGHDILHLIVSNGHASPDGFWYDQDAHEWVLLLEGEADLAWADGERLHLRRGDALHIPAHTRHRVVSTSRPAVWLAVFY